MYGATYIAICDQKDFDLNSFNNNYDHGIYSITVVVTTFWKTSQLAYSIFLTQQIATLKHYLCTVV